MDWLFFKRDLQYIALNCIVNKVPSWHIRRVFYKCMGMKISKGARIGINAIIISPSRIVLGKRSIINDNCVVDGSGGVTIENDVSISSFSKIYSCTHDLESNSFKYITNPIVIKNNVWVAADSMILDHSFLDEYAVIGANSCFKGYARKRGVYYGNPARLRRMRKIESKYTIDFNPHFR